MILAGITIHDPDVVVTDLGLAALGAWCAWRLASVPRTGPLGSADIRLMIGLASAAFWGAIFHAFFPDDTATLAGFLAWIPVSLSIVLAASALLECGLRTLAPGLAPRVRNSIVGAYAAVFAGFVIAVDESFTTIVRFYVPALLFFLLVAEFRAFRRDRGWTFITLGLALSAGAAVLQQLQVALHPVWFDHNAVYHVVQAAALVVLYHGLRRVALTPAP
jgi:hypothetical protein